MALTMMGGQCSLADLDVDGDNKITFEEFSVFAEIVEQHSHPVFKDALRARRRNSSKQVSVFAGEAHRNAAFMQTASKAWRKLGATKTYDEESLGKVFRSIDLDQSGSLDHGEIRLAIKNVAPQITEMEITLMLATSDSDADGKITFPEWKKLMMHDQEGSTPYWEQYGERDMHVSLQDRRGRDGVEEKPW